MTPVNEKKNVTVITHFDKDEDPDCSGDYREIEIKIEDEFTTWIETYGDAYHDRGKEKVEGFIDGLKYAFGKRNVKVKYISVADWEG